MAEPLRLFYDPEPARDPEPRSDALEPAYDIRVSARARRIRVIVEHDGRVEVVLPPRATRKDAAAAVTELGPWIARRVRDAEDVRRRLARTPGTVPYLGVELRLIEQAGRARVHRRGDDLLVPAGEQSAEAIERFYRRRAHAEVGPRLDVACVALGRSYTTLTIRNQRTRWGSCSSSGAMSFNWRLLLAPEDVLDYVVWHEACHLAVMNHSAQFWALLAHHLPTYRDPERWLRRNGNGLVL